MVDGNLTALEAYENANDKAEEMQEAFNKAVDDELYAEFMDMEARYNEIMKEHNLDVFDVENLFDYIRRNW